MRILIAEDDATTRAVLKKTLHKLGYDVVAAEDGEKAWDLFQQESFPVVLTDWMMPKVDGLELCRRIRSNHQWHRYTYLVILTMLGGKQSFLQGMEAGADDFMTKPIDADELVARLRVAERIIELETSTAYLESMLSACPECRNVKATDGRWVAFERYLRDNPRARVSRGRCPDCIRAGRSDLRSAS